MLVELALGDAYGAGFEFAAPEVVTQFNDPSLGYRPHPKGTIRPGRYTDDTQMTLGLAEYMLDVKTPPSIIKLARCFLWAFKRDPRHGYSEAFYGILKRVKNGGELLSVLNPRSDRSGGAMRATPCGLLPTVSEAIDAAMWQASLTHGTKDGMTAAGAVAALVWACRNGCDPSYLPSFLNDVLPGYPWETPWQLPVPNQGIPVARAALTVLSCGGTMKEMLQQSVAFTGDVDTVAAVVMAAASVHPAAINDLPDELVSKLEGGQYGMPYLRDLDEKLMLAFPVMPPQEEEEDVEVCDDSVEEEFEDFFGLN